MKIVNIPEYFDIQDSSATSLIFRGTYLNFYDWSGSYTKNERINLPCNFLIKNLLPKTTTSIY